MSFAEIDEYDVDVVVIGGGGAGLRVAYDAAREGAEVLLITKGRIGVSGATAVGLASTAGFAVPDGSGDPLDSPDVHYNDVMTAAQGCADPVLARILVDEAIEASEDLDRWDIDFIRIAETGKPLVAQGDFASRPRNRKIYHHGRPIAVALGREIRKLGVKTLEGTTVLSLVQGEDGVNGLIAVTKAGRFLKVKAGATVLTTGGAGQLFKYSLMPPDITGDGYAFGYRAGASLANMEFMQAGFGTIKPALNMIYTWLWGGDPLFTDRDGRSVLEGTLPPGTDTKNAMRRKLEHYPFSASDDSKWLEIAAKIAVQQGRADENGAFNLDLRGIRAEDLPQKGHAQLWAVSREWLLKKNMDITAEPLRVGLFGHAINGGLVIDAHGRTSVPGLLSAGENAAGPYGADRLGGNMLLNCQVFGKRAGRMAAEVGKSRKDTRFDAAARAAFERAEVYAANGQGRKIKEAHRAIKATMTEHALVVRNEAGLKTADAVLAGIGEEIRAGAFGIGSTKDLVDLHEALSMVDVGRAMCAAAIVRKETRGSHYREDAPQLDPALAHPIMVHADPAGVPIARIGAFETQS